MKLIYKHNKPEANNIQNNNNNKKSSMSQQDIIGETNYNYIITKAIIIMSGHTYAKSESDININNNKSSIAEQHNFEEKNNNNNIYNSNYSLILKLIKQLKNEFCNAKFSTLIKLVYKSNNYININLLNNLEYILYNNFYKMEIKNKVYVISIISDKVISKLVDYDDLKWFEILNDFLNQTKIKVEVYFSYLKVFEKLYQYIDNNNKIFDSFFEIKYECFVQSYQFEYFKNRVQITSLNDILFLLEYIIESKPIQIYLIPDNIWLDVDAVVLNFKDEIPLDFYYIMPLLIIKIQNYIDISKSCILFKNSIKALNNNLLTMVKNNRLLEEYNMNNIKFSSYVLIQYAGLYFDNDNDFNDLFCLLNNAYLNKLKSNDRNINWFDHVWYLDQILHKKNFNFQESKEFWNDFFFYFKIFMQTDYDLNFSQMGNSIIEKYVFIYIENLNKSDKSFLMKLNIK